jgi:leucine dehydrogenase
LQSPWDYPDFDDHEVVHFITDTESGLKAIIALHSTALGPAAGGVRFWHYAESGAAIVDALRLSRGMSFKNAMAELPMGGGKAVILAPSSGAKTSEMLSAYGRAVERLCGAYVTAEDVGVTVADLVKVSEETRYVSGLPAAAGEAGGDPGPFTSYGIFLGLKAAVRRALGRDDLNGLHIALQGAGSVGGGLARLAAAEGAKLTVADLDAERARRLAEEVGGQAVAAEDILSLEADVLSPCALGAILSEATIPELRVAIVAGGANNQLATAADGQRLSQRGILYAPDYVINAGGIINVALEYLGAADEAGVRERIERIPARLERIWDESIVTGRDPAAVADSMARALIGRA